LALELIPYEINTYYGLNTKQSRAKLHPGFSPDTVTFHDIDLSVPGVAKTRGGSTTINPLSLLAYAPKRIFDYYKPSTNAHIIIGNGGDEVFTMTVTGTKTVVGTGYTVGEIMDFVNYKDNVYYSNGTDAGRTFNGTSERLWGIVKPVSANTFAADTAGALTGAYQYTYTYYNSTTLGESSNAPFSAVHNVVANTINLTGLVASADPQVDQKRIYRTTNGGAVFLLVATIANATTTYADNTADTALGSTEVPLYNDPPPSFLGMEEWDGRIWGFEFASTKLWYSNDEFLTPAGSGLPWESFGADNFLDYNLVVYGIKKSPNFNELWVHTSGGLYAVVPSGIAEDPYYTRIRNSSWHAISHYSILNIYNNQWFVTPSSKVISIDSSGYLNAEAYLIEPTLALANPTFLSKIQAVHYRFGNVNQYRIVYAEGVSTDFSKMLAANYLQKTPPDENFMRYPVWEYHNIASTCMAVIKNSSQQEILYTGTSDGRIKRQDIGTNDDSSAIDWSMSLGWINYLIGEATSTKIYKTYLARYIVTYYRPLGSWFFNMQTNFDFGNSGGQIYSVKAEPTMGTRFDIDHIFDLSTFAGEQDLIRVPTSIGGDYHYIEFKWFGNTTDQVFEMHNSTILSKEVEGFRHP
jgi:hypothetical protein